MDGNQKIHCTVESCRFNNGQQNMCTLKAIKVSPMEDCDTKTPDESMCSSYEYQNE